MAHEILISHELLAEGALEIVGVEAAARHLLTDLLRPLGIIIESVIPGTDGPLGSPESTGEPTRCRVRLPTGWTLPDGVIQPILFRDEDGVTRVVEIRHELAPS
jgi:hypothetical protein